MPITKLLNKFQPLLDSVSLFHAAEIRMDIGLQGAAFLSVFSLGGLNRYFNCANLFKRTV